MTLSQTQNLILIQAARHPAGLAMSPGHLPPAPRAAVARALLNAGMVERAEAPDEADGWRVDGETIGLRITDAGREAIGESGGLAVERAHTAVPVAAIAAGATAAPVTAEAPSVPRSPLLRPRLRHAATVLLACWDVTSEREPLADAIAALRTALDPTRRPTGLPRGPRQGTKQEAIL